MRSSTQNLGPIGSAVLSFIGYKQRGRQTNNKQVYIYNIEAHVQTKEIAETSCFNPLPNLDSEENYAKNNPKKNQRNAYHFKHIYHIHLFHEGGGIEDVKKIRRKDFMINGQDMGPFYKRDESRI